MMQDTTALRAELIETARGMNLRGINVNKSGNVSAAGPTVPRAS